MVRKVILLFNTVRHLKARQVFYRIYYHFKKIHLLQQEVGGELALLNEFKWNGPSYVAQSLFNDETACFLNECCSIKNSVVWNDKSKSKLWLYNLHYFDDLNSLNSDERFEYHYRYIHRWVDENPPVLGNGWEPYTLSLRLVNLVKWCSRNDIQDNKILSSLAQQGNALRQQFEYHVLANHLFVNAKALVFVGSFLGGKLGKDCLNKGMYVLEQEMKEQFLKDGAHFELSPMYHSLIMWDVLELIDLAIKTNKKELIFEIDKWKEIAAKGIKWLSLMCHPDNDISFFNDSAFSIAPKLERIKEYADKLGIRKISIDRDSIISMSDSGFSRVNLSDKGSVLLINHSEIKPSYQPGHAHADTLSFELSLLGQRVFVNTGTSQYGVSAERNRQRSTLSHNTLNIDNRDSSEVWSGFRVARRAKVIEYAYEENKSKKIVTAAHDGYTYINSKFIHRRSWNYHNNLLVISDFLEGASTVKACSRYHIHPNVRIIEFSNNAASLQLPNGLTVNLKVIGGGISRHPYNYFPEFGLKLQSEFIESRLIDDELNFSISW